MTLAKANWWLVHSDGKCSDGKTETLLMGGFCPACKYFPDMQSVAIALYCPADNARLNSDGTCPTCKRAFDTKC